MYTILLDKNIIHDEKSTRVRNPVLNRVINKAGALSFVIANDNPGYDKIVPRNSLIQIYKGEYDVYFPQKSYMIWSGVVLSYSLNMYGEKEVTCEGALSVLNDVCFEAIYNVLNGTIEGFLKSDFKKQHNDAVSEDEIGSVAVCFSEQNYTGKMHFYRNIDYGTYKEIGSSSGYTASQLSGAIVYFDSDMYMAYEATDGNKKAQSINVDSVYLTNHAISNSYTPSYTPSSSSPRIHSIGSRGVFNVEVDTRTIYQFSGGFRRIDSMTADMPVGGNDKTFNSSYRDSFCSSYEKLMKIIEKYGGYITADITNSGMSINYKETFTEVSGQKIILGDNLQDYIESINFDSVYNKIIPFGKNLGTSFLWDYVTIESVNNNSNFIIDENSVKQLGAISKVVHYTDVEDPAQLKRLAQKDLDHAVNFELSVTVKATDKSILSADINTDAFDIGLLTDIELPPLGIARKLVCTSITNYISEPEKDEYTFGSIPKTSSSYVASGGAGTLGGSAGADIEVISNNGGYCLKFPNGWAIATIWKSVSFTTSMAWGSLWYGDCGKPLGALPITFKNIIYRNITIDDGGSFWPLWNPGNESNWSGTIFPIGAAKQTTAVSLIFRGVCIGTWK